MDRRDDPDNGGSKYQQDLEREKKLGVSLDSEWLTEGDGEKYRMPYRIIKMVIFSNISQKEMVDPQHAARLQYRLHLLEPIIKASVNFARKRITIVYNPSGANNRREQMSQQDIIDYLAKEGVHVDTGSISERDYDYTKEFYNYAYFSPQIREHPPYGYTKEEWEKMRDEYKAKTEKWNKEKTEKFRQWQDQYMESIEAQKNPNKVETKRSIADKILGRNRGPKGKKNEKGFWFHGV